MDCILLMRATERGISMNINFSIEEAVTKRYSVRNYKGQGVEPDKQQEIESFAAKLDNPFGKKVDFHFLDSREGKNEEKLGTYGVIKGAKQYIGTTIEADPMALVALGYEMEALMLYLVHQGIGTCWLGGTFDRNEFAKAMEIDDSKLFPIITPYGYPAAKMHLQEIAMRKMVQADQRKKWNQLFYINDFKTPIKKEEAGELAFPLEMVRLGPSASNKQPWRILLKDNSCHFYEDKEPGYSDRFPYDIQRVDMGIAAAHFDFAAKEKNLKGHFEIIRQTEVKVPDHTEYVFSWIGE